MSNPFLVYSRLGGVSMLRNPYIISYLDDNGELIKDKVILFAKQCAYYGVTGSREFPWWIDSLQSFDLLSPFTLKRYGAGRTSTLSVDTWNEKLFEIHRQIATILNYYGITYIIDLFDQCNNKIVPGAYSPWRDFGNIDFVDEYDGFYFYGVNAEIVRHQYIDKFVDALSGLDVIYEVCNEPAITNATGYFLSDTINYLMDKHKIEPTRIMHGFDMLIKKQNSAAKKVYDDLKRRLGKERQKLLKNSFWSPVHNASITNIKNYYGKDVRSGGRRPEFLSFDGLQNPRPDAIGVNAALTYLYEKKNKASIEQRNIMLEVVYGKKHTDPQWTVDRADLTALMTSLKHYYREYWPFPMSKNELWVYLLYFALLERTPDDNGFRGYVDALNNGKPLIDVINHFLDSDEFRSKSNIEKFFISHRLYPTYHQFIFPSEIYRIDYASFICHSDFAAAIFQVFTDPEFIKLWCL